MAIFTITEIDEQIAAYKAALLALATSQSYEIDVAGFTRRLIKADLPEIRKTLTFLKTERADLESAAASPGAGVSRINVMRVRR